MYCPVCGVESTQGLNYCTRCGTGLAALQTPIAEGCDKPGGKKVDVSVFSLSFAAAVVSILGLGMVLTFVASLARQPNSGDLPLLVLVLGLTMVSAVSGLLIRELSRLLTAFRQVLSAPSPQKPIRAAGILQQITTAPQNPTSITEHTTRNFDMARLAGREAD